MSISLDDLLEAMKENAEEHRRGLSDVQWAQAQPREQNYFLGDVVEFKVGGFGIISETSPAENGWPPSYATKAVEGLPDRQDAKRAWHYEGDFKSLLIPSGLRVLKSVVTVVNQQRRKLWK